jgi:hypothetical protein
MMSQMRGFIGVLMFGALGWVAWSDTPTGFAEVSPGAAGQIRGGSTKDPACKGYIGTAQRCCTGAMNNFTDVYQASTTTMNSKPNTGLLPVCGMNAERTCVTNSYTNGFSCG